MPVTKMIMEPRRWRSKELYDIGHIMSLLYFIAKALAIVVEVIDDVTTSRRHDDGDHDDGDHGVMPVTMMIMEPRR